MINRSALIVRPRAPFIEWVKKLDKENPPPSAEGEQTVYLIPEFDKVSEIPGIIADLHQEIFEKELFSWWTDEADWPAKRDMETFLAWFKVEIHSIVDDLVGDELVDDELDD